MSSSLKNNSAGSGGGQTQALGYGEVRSTSSSNQPQCGSNTEAVRSASVEKPLIKVPTELGYSVKRWLDQKPEEEPRRYGSG